MCSVNNSVKSYLELCRISNLPTVWTNVLAAVLLTGGGGGDMLRISAGNSNVSPEPIVSWSHFLILSLSMSLFYSGGICLNDIFDVTVDSLKKPFRPIPSGRISLQNASRFTGIMFAAALGLLFLMPHSGAVVAGFLLLAAISLYNIFHKEHPSAVVLMAGCRLMIFVVSSISVAGSPAFSAILAGGIHFVYIFVISVTARYENRLSKPFDFPVIPVMIAGISVLDGILMAAFVSPAWLSAGIVGALLTHYGQKFIRGD